ncbi:hypothetical protein [Nocardioides aquiterrae]|uniref:Calcium-binding protein n=1 Tax=Nocardioides aquiterrae TaxID=203799 RepID=A0ABP4F352_9ACTN
MKTFSGSALVAPLALAAGLLSLAGPAGAGAPTCQGRPATIVGHPGSGDLVGTPGDDVIVTRGAGGVRAKAGDDRVCVTGASSDGHVYVDAGPGDDRVVTSTPRSQRVSASLGEGDDTFRGGPEPDGVQGEGPVVTGDGIPAPVEGLDRISTGGGSDSVRIGLAGSTSHDEVDLGAGDDLLQVDGLLAPDVRPRGRAGTDTLWPMPDQDGHAWSFDNVTETALMDGAVQSRWQAFEHFVLTWLKPSSVDFTGGPAGEEVTAPSQLTGAAMGAGDDRLYVGLPDDHVVEARGGSGHDLFFARADAAVTVDLPAGAAWDETGAAIAPDALLRAFEDAGGLANQVRLVGDDGDNLLDAAGCDVGATGGAGDDRLRSSWVYDTFACNRTDATASFAGGHGDDVLLGGGGPDRLLGGPGHDRAVGKHGRDLCRAEVRRTCERR